MNMAGVPLIVVDMQNGFVNRRSEHVVPAVRMLTEAWLNSGGEVFFTRFINTKDSQWERWIDWHRLQSSPEIDIHPELVDLAEKSVVVDKNSYSGVVGAIATSLKTDGWHSAVICGIATDGCVMQTAIDLFEKGVRPIVVVDACASHAGPDVHDMGVHLLGRAIGSAQLVTMDSVLTKA